MMTIEQLKAEAEKLGYKVIKKYPYISLSKCPYCGGKPREWFSQGGSFYRCENCGYDPRIICKTNRSARQAWNNAVEKEMENGK